MTNVPGAKHRPKVGRARRHAIYIRDDWTCQHCGRKFEPSPLGKAPHEVDPGGKRYPFYNDVWLEIDHIHPWHHGGGSEIENLQSLCTPCNRRKSNRLAGSNG